ncbi:precorrin-3B C(17)-methyltransferase, partial [Candidatus Entotheonella palauensis]
MSTAGSLYVIGLGPGDPKMLTEQAKIALRQSQVVIGYQGYFASVQDIVQEKECIALPLTQETQRAQVAVDRALQGEAVCVISSGDAGIYGMASLVLEVLEQRTANVPCPEVAVVPGVSAVNACASLLGAPIGHDFAVISLSDLLTPWELI